MTEADEAYYEQVLKERDDLLHAMEVLDRQIDELCARDDFEKAEQLDVEKQTLEHRLELVEAMLPLSSDEEEDAGPQLLLQDTAVARNSGLRPRGNRASLRLKRDSIRGKNSQRNSTRGSGQWQDIPLTPTVPAHKSRVPPSHRPAPPPPIATPAPEVCEAVVEALSTPHILDTIFSFLTPEELARMCSVSRVWLERVEQDELWQRMFRAEWQQEVNPSPGTYKRWYGAMRSASLSWQSPILQQECVKHESFSGRVEIKTIGTKTYLVAMSMEMATIWNYGSLQLEHEIRRPCAYALGSGAEDSSCVRLIGGDKKAGQWLVWDVQTGQQVFSCAADEGAFSGGWYIVYRNWVVIYRRSLQILRGYRWNYETPDPSDISPPMFVWETVGNFAMPKATRFGLLVTDFLRGLVRVDFETGEPIVLLKERSEDLDPRGPKVMFVVDRGGMLITRRAVYKNSPVLIYDHYEHGVSLQKSVAVLPETRFCVMSEDLKYCVGIREDEEGKPLSGVVWRAGSDADEVLELPLSLSSSRSRYLDAALCNNVVAALFGDMFRPSELILWDAKTGKELHRLTAELGERPYQLLRFTGLTACMVHKDGALTKVRVVGRRREKEEAGGCTLQ